MASLLGLWAYGATDGAHPVYQLLKALLWVRQNVAPFSKKVWCISLYLRGLQRALAAPLAEPQVGFFILLQGLPDSVNFH